MKKYFVGNNIFKYDNIENCSINDVVNYCSTKNILSIDIETTRKYRKGTYPDGHKNVYKAGLDPFLSNIVMLQIGDLDAAFCIDIRQFSKEALQPLLNFLDWNKEVTFVGHNLKFEGKHLKHNYGISLHTVWDTMLCEINLTNGLNLGYSLADLAVRYLGSKKSEDLNLFNYNDEEDFHEQEIERIENQIIDKSTRLGFLTIEDKPFTQEQIEYGLDDVIMPLKIRELQLQSDYNPIVCHKLENKFSQVLADLELRGMNFDKQKWMVNYEKSLVQYRFLKEKLDNYVIDNIPEFTGTMDLFNKKGTCKIMWSSSKQVISLFKFLGFCPKEKSKQTKRLEYTVGDKSLFKLLDQEHKKLYYERKVPDINTNQTLILVYLLYKKYEQSCTTFGKDWLKYVHPITHKVHSNYKQILNTGRMSSSNPNLQNIPANKEYRQCFTAPVNYKVINADYSAQEIRILAEVSQVSEMQDFFLKGNEVYGDDFHAWVADKSFKVIYNDPNFHVPPKEFPDGSKNPAFNHTKERNTSKNISFKVSYGGSAYTMKDEFGVTEEEAQKFIDGWFAPFKGLKENFEKTKKEAVKNGYILIDNFTNRKWFFKEFSYMNEIQKKVMSLYPENWKQLSKEEKEDWKILNKHITGPYWKEYFSMKSSLERKSLNFRIQGLAGGMTKLACILIYDYLIENKIDYAYLNNIVHDETNSYCVNDEEKLNLISKLVEESMIKAGKYFCKKVPMNATAVVGNYWSH